MASDDLSIDLQVEPGGNVAVFALRGSLDLATSPSLRSALLEAADNGQIQIIVDLTAIEFIDSTGLGSLIGAHRRAQEHGGSVRLVVHEGPISRLFNITGLVRVFGMYATLEDALRAAQSVVAQP